MLTYVTSRYFFHLITEQFQSEHLNGLSAFSRRMIGRYVFRGYRLLNLFLERLIWLHSEISEIIRSCERKKYENQFVKTFVYTPLFPRKIVLM